MKAMSGNLPRQYVEEPNTSVAIGDGFGQATGPALMFLAIIAERGGQVTGSRRRNEAAGYPASSVDSGHWKRHANAGAGADVPLGGFFTTRSDLCLTNEAPPIRISSDRGAGR